MVLLRRLPSLVARPGVIFSLLAQRLYCFPRFMDCFPSPIVSCRLPSEGRLFPTGRMPTPMLACRKHPATQRCKRRASMTGDSSPANIFICLAQNKGPKMNFLSQLGKISQGRPVRGSHASWAFPRLSLPGGEPSRGSTPCQHPWVFFSPSNDLNKAGFSAGRRHPAWKGWVLDRPSSQEAPSLPPVPRTKGPFVARRRRRGRSARLKRKRALNPIWRGGRISSSHRRKDCRPSGPPSVWPAKSSLPPGDVTGAAMFPQQLQRSAWLSRDIFSLNPELPARPPSQHKPGLTLACELRRIRPTVG